MNNQSTLYWHDYETWGTDPARDKPAQFAGIRTDEDLNIIGDPLMIYCRPPEDCLPQPMACLVTGIAPQKAEAEGLPEPEFMAQIHREFIQAGTCGVGYNSIRFDDEVTRYGLYRNFYDPYKREWFGGNSRWDIIDMVRLTYALRPQGIEWPEREAGVPSFRLEQLTAANGIAHEGAHDALSDVLATIEMARLIRQKQPKLYEFAYRLRRKQEATKLIDVHTRKPLLHISGKVPAANGHLTYILPLAMHPVNRNAVICANLGEDPEAILSLDADQLRERLYTPRAELPEGAAPAGLKLVHLNKCPILAPPNMLDDRRAAELGIDKARCEAHWQKLRQADVAAKVREVFTGDDFPQRDAEASLYAGFISDADRDLCREVLGSPPERLASLGHGFSDERLPELLFRYRARNYPATLSEKEQVTWRDWVYRRLTDPAAGGSLTLEDYFNTVEALRADHTDPREQALLDQLVAWGDSRLA
ncbi:exodeoxyribonuclease I [Biformimicrobium ophioploci]|uniref:Exodeoxyribonuclease I n=1 Tax=Biformimicrobium ophioploci TaxID=3036711 RepID=A0ABQ6LZ50_9GAMM|nr:exodeoxyribonuclease I [Microbulbifer sp. NKW57]GMG87366.1 exodeoxyribonuclease I [Microbulbifer sp. NKW57]